MADDLAARQRAMRQAVERFKRDTAGQGDAAPVRVTFNDDNAADTRSVSRLFVGLGATLDVMPAVLRSDGVSAIRAGFARNFDREAERRPWAALAPATIAERLRLGFGPGPILRRTGALRRHVLQTPARITRTGSTIELRIKPGNSVGGVPKYGPLAMGTSRMPGRPMVVLTPPEVARVVGVISRALRTRAIANGLG